MKKILTILLIPTFLISEPTKQLHRLVRKKPIVKVDTQKGLEDKIKGIILLGAYSDAHGKKTKFEENYILKVRRPNNENGFPIIPKINSILNGMKYLKFSSETEKMIYCFNQLILENNDKTESIVDSFATGLIDWIHTDQIERFPTLSEISAILTIQQLSKKSVRSFPLWSRGRLKSFKRSEITENKSHNEIGTESLARVMPISIFFMKEPEFAEEVAVTQTILTNLGKTAAAVSAGLNNAILMAISGKTIENIWESTIFIAEKYDPEISTEILKETHQFVKNGRDNKNPEIVFSKIGGDSAINALSTALYIFSLWKDDPYLAISMAINRLPKNNNLIAKIVAELLAAFHGYEKVKINFEKYGIDLDQEILLIEQPEHLYDYKKNLKEFNEKNIKSFSDLAMFLTDKLK